MEIEYSNEIRGGVYAYRFENWEKKYIATALKFVIPKLEKKIKKIEKNPKNEGQVRYSQQIKELSKEVEILQETIKEFEA